MPDLFLLQSQKNEVLDLINKSNLPAFNFAWDEVATARVKRTNVSIIRYVGTDFYFQFDVYRVEPHVNNHYAIFSPGDNKRVQETYTGEWGAQCGAVVEWLINLRNEINAPDLWAAIERQQLSLEGRLLQPDASNEPFTIPEFEQIVLTIGQVRALIESKQLASGEQLESIKKDLSLLKEAAKQQGRRQWFFTLVGVLNMFQFAYGLGPEVITSIWGLIRPAIKGAIKLLPQ